MTQAALSKGLSGIAGEYFVAAELSRQGYVASLTLRNTKGIDILASNSDATRSVGIQVKTNKGTAPSWMMTSKIEDQDLADNLFFVFVRLNDGNAPSYHVASCAAVVEYARESHRKWLRTPGRKGQSHNDTSMRKFDDPEGEYLDCWSSLGLG